MNKYLTYAKYDTAEEAHKIAAILAAANIQSLVERDKEILDAVYIGNSFDPMYLLKIAASNFTKANQVLVSSVTTTIEELPADYYLLQFSPQELLQVIQQTSEWNYFDQAMAQKLLAQANITAVASTQTNANYSPTHLGFSLILMQYTLSALLAFAGFIIGLATLLSYKTLPNGQKSPMFSKSNRQHAWGFLGIGLIRFIFWVSPFFSN